MRADFFALRDTFFYRDENDLRPNQAILKNRKQFQKQILFIIHTPGIYCSRNRTLLKASV